MTDEELALIKARAEGATAPPWHAQAGSEVWAAPPRWWLVAKTVSHGTGREAWGQQAADGQFIAHAREDVPALVDEVHRLTRLVRNLTIAGGPYSLGRWTDEIRHVDPCDCDLDEENAGDNCMANSDWTYAVFVDGRFAELVTRLPRNPHLAADETFPLDKWQDFARLLAAARQALDLAAIGPTDLHPRSAIQKECGEVAQRIVDLIGHDVTDERPHVLDELDALRAENARLRSSSDAQRALQAVEPLLAELRRIVAPPPIVESAGDLDPVGVSRLRGQWERLPRPGDPRYQLLGWFRRWFRGHR